MSKKVQKSDGLGSPSEWRAKAEAISKGNLHRGRWESQAERYEEMGRHWREKGPGYGHRPTPSALRPAGRQEGALQTCHNSAAS